jgi:adenylate cyclase
MSQVATGAAPQGNTPEQQGFEFNRYFPTEADGMISPLHEIPEPEFTLDVNLDDMTGIVDTNLINAPPPTAAPTRHPTLANAAEPGSGWALQDALQEHPQRSEGSSGSTSSSQPSSRDIYRESINPANNPFTKQNPFAARSSNGSDDVKPASPTSPYTYSPKHSLPPTNQPRRPSQLRNVKMGSIDSQGSASSSQGGLQPIWSSSLTSNPPTVFKDPFKLSMTTPTRNGEEQSTREETTPRPDTFSDSVLLAPVAAIHPPNWAAPESWGVEGDEEVPDDETSSSSVEGEDEWTAGSRPASPGAGVERRLSLMIPSLDGKKPPPFGFKSKQGPNGSSGRPSTASRGQRAKTRDGRPSTSARTISNRPGTSGSAHLTGVPVSLTRQQLLMTSI